MSESVAVEDGVEILAGGERLRFSPPVVIGREGRVERAAAGNCPGILAVLTDGARGPGEDARKHPLRLLDVFVLESRESTVPRMLWDRTMVDAGDDGLIFGAFLPFPSTYERGSLVIDIREDNGLPYPPEVEILMALPLKERDLILAQYPMEVDLEELQAWESIDDTIKYIDD